MKKCPFCAEEIQDEAIKCRYCGSDLYFKNEGDQRRPDYLAGKEIKSLGNEFIAARSEAPKTPWYGKTAALIVSFLAVGPFALPLVWFNPVYSRRKKIIVTVIVLVLTGVLVTAFLRAATTIYGYYKQVGIF